MEEKKKMGWGYLDRSGAWVLEPKFEKASPFSDGLALVCSKSNGLFGFINRSGAWVIEPQYDQAADKFSEGLARVEVNGKYGFIDKNGTMVVEPQYDNADSFSEGLAPFMGKVTYLKRGYNDRS